MWFDVTEALAEVEGTEDAASDALVPLERAGRSVAEVAVVAGQGLPKKEGPLLVHAAVKDLLPAYCSAIPHTCAICGVSEWNVSLTDIDRRRLHVSCWKAEAL